MTLDQAITYAVDNLPDGWSIHIAIERNGIDTYLKQSSCSSFESGKDSTEDQIKELVDKALEEARVQ